MLKLEYLPLRCVMSSFETRNPTTILMMVLMVDGRRVVVAKKELEEMMISSAKSPGPFDDLL